MRVDQVLAIGRKVQHVIVTPHPDDEIIGCYQIIADSKGVGVHVVHVPEISTPHNDIKAQEELRYLESKCAFEQAAKFNVTLSGQLIQGFPFIQSFLFEKMMGICLQAVCDVVIYWFPDPEWETHIHHKMVGNIGREFTMHLRCKLASMQGQCHPALLVGYYSVNMKAPYVTPLCVEEAMEKRRICGVFASQADYFEHHQESWIFEGRIIL